MSSKISEQKINNFDLMINELGNLDKNEGISVAFALDNETIAIERIDSYYKIVIDLGAQALFFDFTDMKVIGCYPIAIQLIDVYDSKPNDDQIRDIIRELFVGNKYKLNIFNEFSKKLEDIKIKPKFQNSIQVTNVIVEERALPFLPEAYKSDIDNCRVFLAQNFSKLLSTNQGISVLPYTKGSAIGKKMAARFSNGDIYNLEIPDSQYNIDLTLRGFKKVKYAENKLGTSWIYGAYSNLKIYQPLLQKIYIDEKFKNGATKIVPIKQKNIDDWPAFQESLFVLFDKITKELSTNKKYKSINKIIERCK
ncbi:MAG: hypothetical protein K8R67_16735 [Desulfobacteraceae bacterium]|nr:hypothetical protein [Desulfobacteraceae bacterium]